MRFDGQWIGFPEARPWQKWFAWFPVKVHDERVWTKWVYRRHTKIRLAANGMNVTWEYGTIFDVLNDPENTGRPNTPPSRP